MAARSFACSLAWSNGDVTYDLVGCTRGNAEGSLAVVVGRAADAGLRNLEAEEGPATGLAITAAAAKRLLCAVRIMSIHY